MRRGKIVDKVCPQCGKAFQTREKDQVCCSHWCCHKAPRPGKPLEQRFWERVEKTDECWNWVGTINSSGYGLLPYRYKRIRAHIVSYELHVSKVPDDLCVLHKCDNRKCVRPDHLFLGTRDDNMADMVAKNRSPQGERNARATLTVQDVLRIRSMYAKGSTPKILGDRFNVLPSHILLIVRRKRWKHI